MERKGKVPLTGISSNTTNKYTKNNTTDNSQINSTPSIPKQNVKERMRCLQAVCKEGQDPLSTIKRVKNRINGGKCGVRFVKFISINELLFLVVGVGLLEFGSIRPLEYFDLPLIFRSCPP